MKDLYIILYSAFEVSIQALKLILIVILISLLPIPTFLIVQEGRGAFGAYMVNAFFWFLVWDKYNNYKKAQQSED